jgi:hypothetical protein
MKVMIETSPSHGCAFGAGHEVGATAATLRL